MVTVPHEMVGLERMSDYRGLTEQWNTHTPLGLEKYSYTQNISLSEIKHIGLYTMGIRNYVHVLSTIFLNVLCAIKNVSQYSETSLNQLRQHLYLQRM